MPRIPWRPRSPERVCWGCDTFCPVDDLACGNGTIAALHPAELFGDDWLEWVDARDTDQAEADTAPSGSVAAPEQRLIDDRRPAREHP